MGACSLALRTDFVALERDFLGGSEIEVLERHSDFDLHVVALRHASASPEHVEEATSLLICAAAFLVFFETLEASGVVDEFLLLVGQHLVRLGHLGLLAGSR